MYYEPICKCNGRIFCSADGGGQIATGELPPSESFELMVAFDEPNGSHCHRSRRVTVIPKADLAHVARCNRGFLRRSPCGMPVEQQCCAPILCFCSDTRPFQLPTSRRGRDSVWRKGLGGGESGVIHIRALNRDGEVHDDGWGHHRRELD